MCIAHMQCRGQKKSLHKGLIFKEDDRALLWMRYLESDDTDIWRVISPWAEVPMPLQDLGKAEMTKAIQFNNIKLSFS